MSATNRGRARNARDLYETPAEVTRAILPWLNLERQDRIWEGAAGNGAIIREVMVFGWWSLTGTCVMGSTLTSAACHSSAHSAIAKHYN